MILKEKIKLGFWTILSSTLGILFVYAFFLLPSFGIPNNSNTAKVIDTRNQKAESISTTKYFYINTSDKDLKLASKAYLVGDLNTGEVVLSKNQDTVYPMASVSKLMTALITKEVIEKDDTATVSKKALATSGTNGELRLNEKIKTSELIFPLLLESSNDAAEVLAEHFGRDSFISKMNTEAENLKMDNTKYEDPSGLSRHNVSTVADMFKLAGYLNQNKPELLKITDTRSYSTKKHSWSNISQFFNQNGYFGGKSGYTDPAKQTVISLFNLPLGQTGTRPIAITLLQSTDRKKDVLSILKYLKQNVYYGGTADAYTDWVKEKVGGPDIRDPDFITFTFGGDIMMDRGVRNSVVKNFNNDYSALFENLKSLKDSDIVFANLEGTAGDQGKDLHNLYSFRMDGAVVPALANAGISIVSVANNHVGDWGRASYIDTLSRLKENEILYTGGGSDATEAETPTIIEKYGMRIGFLGFSDVGPDTMQAGTDTAGLLIANNPRFDEIIQNAAKQVDYLIVSFHFGIEYQTKHNARQEYLAHKAVDNGAKLIIGSHPHVPEDTEVYKNSYIAYSLGNFIFDQSWSAPTMQGMILNLRLGRDGSITVRKDTVKLNSAFQPQKLILGKEEKIKFQEVKPTP